MSFKIGVISLGCAKNRVDTETLMGALSSEYEFVNDIEKADIVIINTCTFINDAKEESINTILESEQQKKFGSLKKIIVTGCLAERYKNDLVKLLPGVDAFLGVAAYKDINTAIENALAGEKYINFESRALPERYMPRFMTTQKPTAYVKIAEGCDNNCAYCVIPSVRGPLQSRKMDDIFSEMVTLVQNGYTEIVFVAQDTAVYGRDISGRATTAELLDRAARLPGLKWLRLLYCYPEHITEELIDVMLKHDNIVKYIDMPIQHTDNDILKKMNRSNTFESTLEKVKLIRSKSPEFVLRTTLITGFPGETREAARKMRHDMDELDFDRVGVFKYSQEEGTAAALMAEQVSEDEKDFRYDSLMTHMAKRSLEKNKARVGKTYEVLIEGVDAESCLYVGRSYAEAPESDGKILVASGTPLVVGRFYNVKITHGYNYDLKGEAVIDEHS